MESNSDIDPMNLEDPSLHEFGPGFDETDQKLPLLPNYTKNPELELEKTVRKLKGGDLSQFKKDIPIPVQKLQPTIKGSDGKGIPKELLDKHINQISMMNNLGGVPPAFTTSPPQGSVLHNMPMGVEVSNPKANSGPLGNVMPGSSNMQCKFLNSKKCHPDYPNFSGASIGFPEGMNMKCDSVGEELMPKAVCTISGGKINGVYIINKGSGLAGEPKIEAVGGGGKGATFKPVYKNGSVEDVKVIDGGEGYHETPQIKFVSSSSNSSCYLCCK